MNELDNKLLEFQNKLENIDKNDIPSLCNLYRDYYEFYNSLEESFKIAEQIKQKLSYEVMPTAFENNKVDSVKIRGRNFIVGVRLNASIPLDLRANGHAWLRENNLGEIIVPTVNSKTLSSAVKSYIEEVGKQPPDTAIKIHMQKYTSMRKT